MYDESDIEERANRWLRRCRNCTYRLYGDEPEVWGRCNCEDSVMYGKEVEENDVCIHHEEYRDVLDDILKMYKDS